MISNDNFERAAASIAALSREQLTSKIKNFKGRFRLNFTDDYLKNLTVDRLRHVLLAATINARPRN